jgi:hypothetical protein
MTLHLRWKLLGVPCQALSVGLLLLGGCLSWGPAPADTVRLPDSATARDTVVALGVPLPHTDGADLAPRRPALTAAESEQQLHAAQRVCEGPCVTPFGARLGVADGVEARSNCGSTCLHLEYSFVDRDSGQLRVALQSPDPRRFEYAGVTYQCVEYARRWWIRNRGLTFGDVPTAADIFTLTEGLRLPGREPVPLGRSLNGSAQRAPERGDLVIYGPDPVDPKWRFGHVAVVVAVDAEQGWIALAEENYDNHPWRDPEHYARRIGLFTVHGRYTLVDVTPGTTRNPDGGRILGWVYPLAAR